MKILSKMKGFTLAEVLITLTIIGVVAALTIPSLLANVNDKTYEQKRKGLQTRLAQAVSQMDSLNSYLDTEDPVKNSSMRFVVDGLSKVYKITNVCEFENFAACDFPEKMGLWWQSGQVYTKNFRLVHGSVNAGNMRDDYLGGPRTDAVTFRTKNGESFLLWYNPYCIAEQDVPEGGSKIFTREVCVMFNVDLDGAKKGPNIIGHDIMQGIILYPDLPYVVVMNPFHAGGCASRPSYSASGNNAEQCCSLSEAHGAGKGALSLATREQTYTLSILLTPYGDMWTSSVDGSTGNDYGWMVSLPYAKYIKRSTNSGTNYCVMKESKK